MMQIANMAATIGGRMPGAGKGHGMKPGAADDFAALVAGAGGPADPTAPADAGDVILAEDIADGDAETGADTEREPAGQPVIQDLALGAAAQSAMADMIVTPPVHPAAKPPSGAEPSLPEIEGVGPASARVRAMRATFGIETRMAPTAPAPSTRAGGIAGTPPANPEEVRSAFSGSPTAGQTTVALTPATIAITQMGKAGEGAPPLSGEIAASLRAPGEQALDGLSRKARPAFSGSRTAGQTTSAVLSTRTAAPGAPVQPDAAQAMSSALLRQLAAPGLADAPADAPSTPATIPIAPSGIGRDESSLPPPPSGLRNPAESAPDAAQSTFRAPVFEMPPDSATPLQPPVHAMQQPKGEGAPYLPAAAWDDTAAATSPTQTIYTAVQPVMSALHRATTLAPEVKATESAPVAMVTGEASHRSGRSSPDSSSNHDSRGSALGDDDGAQASTIPADSSPAGRPFADIIQSLPPIARSRIGAVGDTASVGGAPDVGATLQGQAIDMTVGGQWIDRVAKEITALAQGTGHSRFQLSPPNLGRIQIDVWQGEGGGKVQLLTETDEAARHLRDGQSSLQADARLATLQLSSITIDRATNGFDAPPDRGIHQQPHRSDQGTQNGQTGTQANMQGGNQQNGQQSGQAGLQAGMQGGNSSGQGKSSPRRDVLNHQADTVTQQGGTPGRDGDRLVRYA